ncbi:hypothetical protein [Bacteriovorax sp. Seq25_V]|uniref:hypothetical protein n=1 Tax=Bacteriovorax sp. Seq25_V TaxID=1201288 RepID=UPI00038A037B|nr:hypothetical protein [Bacteriovorax sp. Seq25_V]EQC44792.1 hypothetical protein M900_0406 [Bacteriovorax sp. Seq25_V]
MKRITNFITLLALLISFNSNALIIKAEETEGKFLKVDETERGYQVKTCDLMMDSMKCEPLFGEDVYFSRADLDSVSSQNYRNSLYAVVGDVGAVVAGFVIGSYVGLGVGMYILAYDGAALACGAFLTGTVPGVITGAAAGAAFDALDPFIHRDLGIAFDAAIETADESDLDDVDSHYVQDELAIVIEDINYNQLEDKFIGQLRSKIKVEGKEKSRFFPWTNLF